MPPTPRPADPRLQAFRDEARSIIALSGGINAVSMGKVRHRGQAAGLSIEEVDDLVADLRAGERAEPKNLTAFRSAVHSILKKSRLKPGDMLTPRLSKKLEQTGISRFRLSPSTSAQVVREQAREFDLKRLSPEAAADTFRQQVSAARARGPLTPARMKLLRKFADTLGIDAPVFDVLVREEVRTALAHPVEVRKANRRFLGSVISAAVFAVLGFFLAMSFFRPRIVPPAHSSASAPSSPKSPASVPANPSAPPVREAAAEAPKEPALTVARRVFSSPSDAAILDVLGSAKEAERLGAMRSLLLRLDRHRETAEQQQALERLLSSLLATDPSSSLVTMTLQSLRDRLSLFSADTTLSGFAVDSGFWTLNTLLEALVEPEIDPDRAEVLAKEIDLALGAGSSQALLVARGRKVPQEAHNLRAKYAQALYHKLTTDASRDASRSAFAEAEKTVFERAGGVLPDDDRLSRRADFLSTALEASGNAWELYLDAVGLVLDQGTLKDVEKISAVYLSTPNRLLQQALDQEFRKRLKGATGLTSPSSVAEAFRLRTRSGGSRRASFDERAKAALARAKASKGPTETMRQVVDLTLASTLACALDQGESAFPEFDTLRKGPPKIDSPSGSAIPAAPTPPPPATFFRGLVAPAASGLDQSISALGSSNPFQRITACQSLAGQVLPDNLPDHQAFAIARYVLWGGKGRQEDGIAGTSLIPLTKPESVKLAMADAIGEVRPLSRKFRMIDASAAERMLISITGQPVNLDASDWKDQARRILLSLVLTDLDPGLDTAAEQYRLLYQTQGRLLGMPESDALLTARPSQMIEVVTNHLVSVLSKSRDTLSESDRQSLDRVSQDLTIADYLASDEPQRLVLVQRAWLRAIALHAASRRPEIAPKARDLAGTVTDKEAHGDDVLEQLRDGEQRALQIWQLLIQAKK